MFMHLLQRPERLLSALKPLDGGSSSGTYPSSLMSPKDQHFEDCTDSGVMSLADVLIPSAQLSDLEQFSSTADKSKLLSAYSAMIGTNAYFDYPLTAKNILLLVQFPCKNSLEVLVS